MATATRERLGALTNTNVRLSPALVGRIDALAARHFRTRTAEIRCALSAWAAAHDDERPQP